MQNELNPFSTFLSQKTHPVMVVPGYQKESFGPWTLALNEIMLFQFQELRLDQNVGNNYNITFLSFFPVDHRPPLIPHCSQNHGCKDLMQQCWSSTESCERRLKRKLWSRAFQWAVVCTILWRIGAAASNRRSHDFGLRFWEQWREVGGDQWERKKILSYPGNLNIPGCKNLLVPKY